MRTFVYFSFVWIAASLAIAQQPLVEEGLIERGLAAYSAGNVADAIELFKAAAYADVADPRPHYLLAACLMQSGRNAESRVELLAGAQLEAQSPNAYPVQSTVQQLVGPERRLIDAIRYRAITGEPISDAMLDRGAAGSNTGVLRQRVALSLGDLARPVSLAEVLQRPPQVTTPLRADTDASSPTNTLPKAASNMAGPPLQSAANELPDPFADDPESAARSDSTDPFAPPDLSSEGSDSEPTTGERSVTEEGSESPEPASVENDDPFADL